MPKKYSKLSKNPVLAIAALIILLLLFTDRGFEISFPSDSSLRVDPPLAEESEWVLP